MKTHLEYFLEHVKKTPNEVYLRQPTGDIWHEITWQQAYDEAAKMANYITSLDFPKGSNIGIVSKNCDHWILADLAIMMAGHVSTPFYPNVSAGELKYLIERSEAKLLFIGKLDVPIWENMKTIIPTDLPVVSFPHYKNNGIVEIGKKWKNITTDIAPLGKIHVPELHDIWTILFTSGTTGEPKGVVLNYRSAAELMEMEAKHNVIGVFNDADKFVYFSYLPLNHIAERIIVEIASFFTGGSISFSESLDRFVFNLQAVQPNTFMSVPRIYTKFRSAVIDKLGERKLNLLLSIPIVSSIIKKKIRKGFGLSRAKAVMTSAAPAPQALKDWYKKLGIHLREAYGMTENAAGFCFMPANQIKPNSVGKPIPGVEVKIIPETGEVCMKAPWIMIGYYKDDKKTAEVIKDGWLHTGDKGELDADGHLVLSGRVSDTFKTSKGKFIDPGPLEWKLSANTAIEQICVAGSGIPQPIALVSLSEIGKIMDRNEVVESLKESVKNVNAENSSYQHISTLVVVNDEWNVDNNLLTPTLKIKRNKIDDRYSSNYEKWYESKESVIWE